jgi:hypothetical protein
MHVHRNGSFYIVYGAVDAVPTTMIAGWQNADRSKGNTLCGPTGAIAVRLVSGMTRAAMPVRRFAYLYSDARRAMQ